MVVLCFILVFVGVGFVLFVVRALDRRGVLLVLNDDPVCCQCWCVMRYDDVNMIWSCSRCGRRLVR